VTLPPIDSTINKNKTLSDLNGKRNLRSYLENGAGSGGINKEDTIAISFVEKENSLYMSKVNARG